MKKLILFAAITALLLTACNKSITSDDQESKISLDVLKLQNRIQNSYNQKLGHFEKINSFKSFNTKTDCKLPAGVGSEILPTEVNDMNVTINFFGFVWFYQNSLPKASPMTLEVTYDGLVKLQKYSSVTKATDVSNELGEIIFLGIIIPKDKPVTFTLIGESNCGETRYEATYQYVAPLTP